jgi:predicted DCC family thiol-disulfide oxidoreductase YuxK
MALAHDPDADAAPSGGSRGTMTEGEGRHLVLFDGVCGLCNRVVRFILPRDHVGIFDFAALQSETGRGWLRRFRRDPDALDTFVVIRDYRGPGPEMLTRSDAALFVMRWLGHPWRALSTLRLVPVALRDFGYDVAARRRYRWFGQYDTCPLPDASYRRRFVDL